MIKSLNHENVVNYYFRESDQRYEYLGLSLCLGHFGDVIQILNHYNLLSKCKTLEAAAAIKKPPIFSDPSKRALVLSMRKEIREMGVAEYVYRLMLGAVKGLNYLHS